MVAPQITIIYGQLAQVATALLKVWASFARYRSTWHDCVGGGFNNKDVSQFASFMSTKNCGPLFKVNSDFREKARVNAKCCPEIMSDLTGSEDGADETGVTALF
jgi:hypothetical protein